jgi:hypothetical protein
MRRAIRERKHVCFNVSERAVDVDVEEEEEEEDKGEDTTKSLTLKTRASTATPIRP